MPAEAARAWEQFYNGDTAARRLTLTPLLCYALLYGHFALCLWGWLPLWTLCLSAPILIVRWLLATHELLHLRGEHEVDPITRLMPLMLTPLSVGYREFLLVHRGHHLHMATPADPEYFQLRGSPLVGLLNAMSAPEQTFFRWLRREGMDAELVIGAMLRGTLFGLLWFAAGWAFLWYWVPVRLAFGLSYFNFFYALHRRGAEHGVYRVPLPPWGARVFSVLFGGEALLATTYHDLHHRYPRVSAYRLPEIAAAEEDLPQPGLAVK